MKTNVNTRGIVWVLFQLPVYWNWFWLLPFLQCVSHPTLQTGWAGSHRSMCAQSLEVFFSKKLSFFKSLTFFLALKGRLQMDTNVVPIGWKVRDESLFLIALNLILKNHNYHALPLEQLPRQSETPTGRKYYWSNFYGDASQPQRWLNDGCVAPQLWGLGVPAWVGMQGFCLAPPQGALSWAPTTSRTSTGLDPPRFLPALGPEGWNGLLQLIHKRKVLLLLKKVVNGHRRIGVQWLCALLC